MGIKENHFTWGWDNAAAELDGYNEHGLILNKFAVLTQPGTYVEAGTVEQARKLAQKMGGEIHITYLDGCDAVENDRNAPMTIEGTKKITGNTGDIFYNWKP